MENRCRADATVNCRTDALTIVVPVFNRADGITRCLHSIASQSLLPAKVIVVDDGSTDNSAEAARNHPIGADVIKVTHRGAAAARQAGLDRVTTPWTMFFDSDDTMESDHVAAAMAAVNDNIDIIGWDVYYTGLSGKRQRFIFCTDDAGWHNIMHGSMATQRYMARTDLFRRAGGWNAAVGVWDDVELGARLLALKPHMVKIDGVRVNVYGSSDSITGTHWVDKFESFETVLDILREHYTDTHTDWVDFRRAILAGDMWREDPEAARLMLSKIPLLSPAMKFAYHYRRYGGRGAARFLRFLFSR